MDDNEFRRLLKAHLDNEVARSKWLENFLKDWTQAIGELLGVIAAAQAENRQEPAESIAHRLEAAQNDRRLNDYSRSLAKVALQTMYREPPRDPLEKMLDR